MTPYEGGGGMDVKVLQSRGDVIYKTYIHHSHFLLYALLG